MKLSFIIFLLFHLSFCASQIPDLIKEGLINNSSENNDFLYEIPFEYHHGEIIIKIEVGGREYNFLFDTGGYTMITDAVRESNNFETIAEKQLSGANQITKYTNVVKVDSLSLGGLVLKNVNAYQISLDKSPTLNCIIDGGIIGAEIIKNYIWYIDFPNRKIIVTNDLKKIEGLNQTIRLPVYLNSHYQPYLLAKVNNIEQWIMFDTGSTTLLRMSKQDADRYVKKEYTIEGGNIETHNGVLNENSFVFNGNCEVGSFKLTNKPIYYTSSSNLTLLGNPIIKDYIVTLNFPENKIYLLPIVENPPKEGWETFGFTLALEAAKHVVKTIVKGSTADKYVNIGDEIIAINDADVTCSNFCNCKEYFDNILEKEEQIKLSVKREGNVSNIVLSKEKLF